MSEVKRYTFQGLPVVEACYLDAAQSELAALREELAEYKQAVGEFKLTGDYHVDVNALLVEAVTARSLQTSVERSLENRTYRVAELADERNKLRNSLAAAEQRNADCNAEIVAMVESALRRSFSLGQVYWQQADSDSTCQQNKSDQTMETQAQHILNVAKSIKELNQC